MVRSVLKGSYKYRMFPTIGLQALELPHPKKCSEWGTNRGHGRKQGEEVKDGRTKGTGEGLCARLSEGNETRVRCFRSSCSHVESLCGRWVPQAGRPLVEALADSRGRPGGGSGSWNRSGVAALVVFTRSPGVFVTFRCRRKSSMRRGPCAGRKILCFLQGRKSVDTRRIHFAERSQQAETWTSHS